MKISAKEKLLISNLIASCDELINGKFIIADKKVRKILENITQSETVYGLLSDCMTEFDKVIEVSKALVKFPSKQGYINLPEDEVKMLPFVFCVLVDLDAERIDFRNFLKTYFNEKDQTSAFSLFGTNLIKPFRDTISNLFEIDDSKSAQLTNSEGQMVNNEQEETEAATHEETNSNEEENEGSTNVFEVLERIASEMKASLRQSKKKPELEDLDFILDALIVSCQREDMQTINAFILAVHHFGKKVKNIKFLMRELDDTVLKLYE